MMSAVRTTNSPSPALVFLHFGLAGIFLVLACGAALAGAADFSGFYAQPHLLAITHLLVLGWINLCAFGVLVQLVPVVFHAPLRWPWLVWVHLTIYVAGTAALVAAFWSGWFGTPLVLAGGLTWLGIALLVVHLAVTMAGTEKRDASAWIITGALANLLLTATLGVALALNFTHPFLSRVHLDYLKLHAHLGYAGWLLGLIIGVGRRLLPMFLVAPEPPPQRTVVAFAAVQAGLAVWAAGLFFLSGAAYGAVIVGVLLVTIGLTLWLVEAAAIFRSRARRDLDLPLKTAGAALVLLGAAAAVGVSVAILASPSSAAVLAYGALALLGAASLLVQAFLYKILPFLVWLHRWSGQVGRRPVPNLRDLTGLAWMRSQLALYAGGVLALVGGTLLASAPLVRIGTGTLLGSALLLVVNFLRVGFGRPRTSSIEAGIPAGAPPQPAAVP